MINGTKIIDPVKSHFIPAAVIRSIAAGLFMMAFFTGVGIALATSSYGIYMKVIGNRLIKQNPER